MRGATALRTELCGGINALVKARVVAFAATQRDDWVDRVVCTSRLQYRRKIDSEGQVSFSSYCVKINSRIQISGKTSEDGQDLKL